MRKARAALLLLAVSTAVACVPRRDPPPPPPQPERRVPPPVRTLPPPPPAAADWRDIPLTPGNWIYRADAQGSTALFGPATGEAVFAVRCDRARRQVILSRQGTTSGNMMTIRTSSTARNFPLSVQAGSPPYVTTPVFANDRFLDGMAFSRGRFTVELPGTPMLVIPAWPEPARVIEDCRS